jgi:hypothetical protein
LACGFAPSRRRKSAAPAMCSREQYLALRCLFSPAEFPQQAFRACRRCLRCERNSPVDCPEFHECLNFADQDGLQQRVRRSGRSSHRPFLECAPSILSDTPDRGGPKNSRCFPEAEPPVILLRVLRGNTYLADLRDWRSASLYAATPTMSREFTVAISSSTWINTALRKRFSGSQAAVSSRNDRSAYRLKTISLDTDDKHSGARDGSARPSQKALLGWSAHSRYSQLDDLGVFRVALGIRFSGLARARSCATSDSFNPNFDTGTCCCRCGTTIRCWTERRNQGPWLDGRHRRRAHKACLCSDREHGLRAEIRCGREAHSLVPSWPLNNRSRFLAVVASAHEIGFQFRSSEMRQRLISACSISATVEAP